MAHAYIKSWKSCDVKAAPPKKKKTYKEVFAGQDKGFRPSATAKSLLWNHLVAEPLSIILQNHMMRPYYQNERKRAI